MEETHRLYGAEMKIVDCVRLKERKDLRKKWSGKGQKGDEREETRWKQREK